MLPWGLLAASGAGAAGMELIATATGTGSSTSITLSSIPATYKHLHVRITGVLTGNFGSALRLTMNSVTTGNLYSEHQLYSYSSSVYANNNSSSNFIQIAGRGIGMTTYPSVGYIDIVDYANTTKNKTVSSSFGTVYNSSGTSESAITSGTLYSTSAITSLTFSSAAGGTAYFGTGTRISVYGIKG